MNEKSIFVKVGTGVKIFFEKKTSKFGLSHNVAVLHVDYLVTYFSFYFPQFFAIYTISVVFSLKKSFVIVVYGFMGLKLRLIKS